MEKPKYFPLRMAVLPEKADYHKKKLHFGMLIPKHGVHFCYKMVNLTIQSDAKSFADIFPWGFLGSQNIYM